MQVAHAVDTRDSVRMTSGYEKSPDYGGPEPTIGGIVFTIALMIGVSVLVTTCMLSAG